MKNKKVIIIIIVIGLGLVLSGGIFSFLDFNKKDNSIDEENKAVLDEEIINNNYSKEEALDILKKYEESEEYKFISENEKYYLFELVIDDSKCSYYVYKNDGKINKSCLKQDKSPDEEIVLENE